MGSISLGEALVTGKNLVPNPAAGIIAFLNMGYILTKKAEKLKQQKTGRLGLVNTLTLFMGLF
jgi:hypothetical protein